MHLNLHICKCSLSVQILFGDKISKQQPKSSSSPKTMFQESCCHHWYFFLTGTLWHFNKLLQAIVGSLGAQDQQLSWQNLKSIIQRFAVDNYYYYYFFWIAEWFVENFSFDLWALFKYRTLCCMVIWCIACHNHPMHRTTHSFLRLHYAYWLWHNPDFFS